MAAIEAGEEGAESECRDWERSATSLLPVSVCSLILSSPPLLSSPLPTLSFLQSVALQFGSVESGATAVYTRRTAEGRSDGRRLRHEIPAPLLQTPHKETDVASWTVSVIAVPREI